MIWIANIKFRRGASENSLQVFSARFGRLTSGLSLNKGTICQRGGAGDKKCPDLTRLIYLFFFLETALQTLHFIHKGFIVLLNIGSPFSNTTSHSSF